MINKLSLFLFSILISTQASAHTGSHAELALSDIFQHALSSPLHSGIVIAIAAVVSILVTKKYG